MHLYPTLNNMAKLQKVRILYGALWSNFNFFENPDFFHKYLLRIFTLTLFRQKSSLSSLHFRIFPLSGDSKTIKDAPVTFITENKGLGPLCVVEMKGGNHPPITLWWRVAAFKYGLWEIPV